MMKHLKLKKEDYLAAGKAIMADPRCDASVKQAVRGGTSGEVDSKGLLTYITSGKNTWYDEVITSHALPWTPSV